MASLIFPHASRALPAAFLAAFLAAFAAGPGRAAEYHVDPNAPREGDGSARAPWRDLRVALTYRGLAPGDELLLHDGVYKAIRIAGEDFTQPVTLRPAPGEKPVLRHLRIDKAGAWAFRGLTFASDGPAEPLWRYIIHVTGKARGLVFDRITVTSNLTGRRWGKQDWLDRARNGVRLGGAGHRLINSDISFVRHGVAVFGKGVTVRNNAVREFSGDGMRIAGDNALIADNVIKNCYAVDRNHDDGIQAWSIGKIEGKGKGKPGRGALRGGRVLRNTILAHENPDAPLRCDLQGIGMFDGMYEDWTIANNLIVTEHWHGITVMGARRVRIINNTMADLVPATARKSPWIWIRHHKHIKRGMSRDNLIINNIASSIRRGDRRTKATPEALDAMALISGNLESARQRPGFRAPGRGDFRLRPGSAARDAGTPVAGLKTDIRGKPRPAGAGTDIGAYEMQPGE